MANPKPLGTSTRDPSGLNRGAKGWSISPTFGLIQTLALCLIVSFSIVKRCNSISAENESSSVAVAIMDVPLKAISKETKFRWKAVNRKRG